MVLLGLLEEELGEYNMWFCEWFCWGSWRRSLENMVCDSSNGFARVVKRGPRGKVVLSCE